MARTKAATAPAGSAADDDHVVAIPDLGELELGRAIDRWRRTRWTEREGVVADLGPGPGGRVGVVAERLRCVHGAQDTERQKRRA